MGRLQSPTLVGKKIGRLTMIEEVGKIKGLRSYRCKCDCGKEKIITHGNILHNTLSCGCMRSERYIKMNYRHGMSLEKIYPVFSMIKQRCYNPNNKYYKNYGGRGITCERKNFLEFKDDMFESYLEHKKSNKQTSIERINNNGNYSKSNCRRANMKEQQNNRNNNI